MRPCAATMSWDMEGLEKDLSELSVVGMCACRPRCAEPVLDAASMHHLFGELQERIGKHGSRFESIRAAIPVTDRLGPSESPASAAAAAAASRSTTLAAASSGFDAATTVDWVHGIGDDLLCDILREAGVAGTGAAACCCHALHQIAATDALWRAHAQRLDVDVSSATAHRPCRAICRDLCDRKRLSDWLQQVDALARHAGAAAVNVRELISDALRRLARCQGDDFMAAHAAEPPPPELAFAAELLHALLGDGEGEALEPRYAAALRELACDLARECTADGSDGADTAAVAAVGWLRRLIEPSRDDARASGGPPSFFRGDVGRFRHLLQQHRAERVPAARLPALEVLLPRCCLKRLDASLQQRMRVALRSRGTSGEACEAARRRQRELGTPEPPAEPTTAADAATHLHKALCVARLASALIRWAVVTAQLALLSHREQELNALASEILRCKANVPPVKLRI